MKKLLLTTALAVSFFTANSQTLVARYNMNGDATDASPFGNHGVLGGTVSATTDRFGNANAALYFNGGQISTAFNGVSGNGSRTISFWAKIAPGSLGGSPFQYGGGGYGGDFANNFDVTAGGWTLDLSNSAGTVSCHLNDGFWHQYILTYDNTLAMGTAGCRFYRDGTELNNFLGTYNWNGEFLNTITTVPLNIGNGSNMSMDDFEMYAGAFTRAQIDSIYRAEVVPNGCLVGRYDFNNGDADYSAIGNAVYSNIATPTYDRFGNSSSAYAFNGSPGTTAGPCTPIQIPDSPFPMGNGARTISAWVNTTDAINDQVILDYGTLAGGQHCALLVSGGNFVFRNSFISMAGGFVADGNWHHVMFNFDGATGTVLTDNIGTNSGPVSMNTTSTTYLMVGQTTSNGSSQTECFNGNIDDIRIFSCSLSPAQMDSLYNIEKVCNMNITGNPVSDASCAGSSNGSVSVNISNGGTAPYLYAWSPGGATTQTVSGLPAATYTVHVTDNVGCVATTTVSVNEPSSLIAYQAGVTHATCFNYCDGNATMSAAGGTPPYNFQWDASAASQTTALATALCGGSYSCYVTDSHGCTASDVVIINNPNPVDGLISESLSITCPSSCDGELSASLSGGTGLYVSTVWSPAGGTSTIASGLCAGTYTLSITDDSGCTGNAFYTISDPTPMNVTFTMYQPSCAGVCDGALDAIVAGGTGGYTFQWSANTGGQTSSTASNLCAGSYTVTVTDGNSCSTSPFGLVIDPAPLSLSVSKTDVTCYGANDGTASAMVSGGTRPYYYYWTSGGNDSVEVSIGASPNEVVTVVDANSCVIKDSTIVNEPPQILISLTGSPASCGASTGSVTTVVSGGSGGYTYLWNTGATTANLGSVTADNYFLQVYDNTGCYGSESIIITDSDGPGLALNSSTDVSCYAMKNGAIDINISGGTAPYSIEWSNGQLTEDIDSLAGGTYDVVVYDVNGCVATASYPVNEPDALFLDPNYISSSCGVADGAAICSVYGGTLPYAYQWDAATGLQTNSTATGIGAGVYGVVVTDANGCKDSIYVSIDDTNGPSLSVDSLQNAGCILNGGNGAIYTTAYGTPGPYAYQWTNGATTDDITSLGIGIFGLTVTDLSSGCKSAISRRISGQKPGTAQICLASVDTATNHNLIIWNDTVPGIATYEIFRETSTQGNYNSIALIQAGNGNTYEDTLANVDQRPWRYKIKATDSCNIASFYSVQHKTIHLIISAGTPSGLNLSWDQYQGVTYPMYYILRWHTSTDWMVIDSVPSTVITYNDPNPPAGTLKYAVEIHAPGSCGITRGAINTSRSNIKVTSYTGIAENAFSNLFNIYPNPAAENIHLSVEKTINHVKAELRDMLGRLVYIDSYQNFKSKTISLSGLSEGVYYLNISSDDNSFTRKIIVQR